MKRLGIFFFYEKNGDVDDFITYYLADLNKNLTELVVVCNGKLSAQGRAAFEQFTDNIIVRENKGLDVWAYKTALDSYGWAKLTEFDEIVMTNSTLMGPVRPLKEMFDAMWENQDLDFWGLSIHHGAKSNPFKGKHLYNYLPVHIQSHFIVYRQRFVKAPELQNYWDNMPMIESYTDSVQRYEAVFTAARLPDAPSAGEKVSAVQAPQLYARVGSLPQLYSGGAGAGTVRLPTG